MNIEEPKVPETPATPAKKQQEAAPKMSELMTEHEKQPEVEQLNSHRLQNILEMDLPRPKAMLNHRAYDIGQGAIAGTPPLRSAFSFSLSVRGDAHSSLL